MSFSGLRIVRSFVFAGVAVAAALSASAQESLPKRGRSIEFSEPRSETISSNLNQLSAKKPTLKSLEADLKKPFELLSPEEGLGTDLLLPPIRRVTPSPAKIRRMKEQLEKRNEWIYLAPEDYAPGLAPDEMLSLPEYGLDGQEKKRLTPLERYYERLEKARAALTNQAAGRSVLGRYEKDGASEDLKDLDLNDTENPLSSGLSDLEKTFKRLANGKLGGAAPSTENSPPINLVEYFGLGNKDSAGSLQEKSRAMESRLEQFKQLLETRSLAAPNPGGAGFFGPSAGSQPATLPSSPLASPDAFSGGGLRGGLGSFDTRPAPSSLSGLPSVSAGPGLPGWQTPTLAPPPPTRAPVQPTFSMPQRKF